MRLHSTAQAQLALDRVTVDIPSKEPNDRIYLTWRPIKATARCKSSSGKDTDIVLRNAKVGGGSVVLGEARGQTKNYKLKLKLPADGTPVDFWIGGATASTEDLDAVLQVAGDGSKIALATISMMVRIRKNALALTMKERFRFLRALAKMNADSTGAYRTMRNIHAAGTQSEAHHNPAFLPWHRAYLLDFERELQAIDPTVAIPYWRFDEPATVLFSKFFMGVTPQDLRGVHAIFDPRNPLAAWNKFEGPVQNQSGIDRRARGWDPLFETPDMDTQADVLDPDRTTFDDFRVMEPDPHDRVHGELWSGSLTDTATAPLDPLFFMLHANVDRLWAVWQSLDRPARIHPLDSTAFSAVKHFGDIDLRYGHFLHDKMWPWHGASGSPWPAGPNLFGQMRASTIAQAPPGSPHVRDMIDYQGIHTGWHFGFDYDDVKFPKDP